MNGAYKVFDMAQVLNRTPHPLKTTLKIAVSVGIVSVVLRNIDAARLWETLQRVQPVWLVWAMLWFVVSKLMAAFRFNDLLKTEGIHLTRGRQLRLYWLGMYYNLLLPGGISGDGYKIKILLDHFKKPFKRLFAVTLFDRLSGVVALGQLCLMLLPFVFVFRAYWWAMLLVLMASLPVSKFIFDRVVGGPPGVWQKTSLQAIAVQAAQLLSALGLVFALAQEDRWIGYAVLFLVSSVVAMMPLTIGGTGARELTFLWGAKYLGADPAQAVAIAFLFYLISTAAAFWGIAYSFKPVLQTATNTPESP